MLKFYYNPISANARRVWVALLEKKISFEPILMNLDGDQFSNEFQAINPLQRIPVIIDNGMRVVESLAILDYLEAKYPTPSLMPNRVDEVTVVRMVEMIAVNELQPSITLLSRPFIGLEVDPQKADLAQQQIRNVLKFYESLLEGHSYFVKDQLTLAEIVAGTLVPVLPQFGFSLENYPSLKAWLERLEQRESWQKTALNPDSIVAALPHIRKIMERRS